MGEGLGNVAEGRLRRCIEFFRIEAHIVREREQLGEERDRLVDFTEPREIIDQSSDSCFRHTELA